MPGYFRRLNPGVLHIYEYLHHAEKCSCFSAWETESFSWWPQTFFFGPVCVFTSDASFKLFLHIVIPVNFHCAMCRHKELQTIYAFLIQIYMKIYSKSMQTVRINCGSELNMSLQYLFCRFEFNGILLQCFKTFNFMKK